MSTISTITGQIATDMLKRSDLTTMLTNQCVNAYKSICSRVPFEELYNSYTLTATADVATMNLVTLLSTATQPALAGIISLFSIYGTPSAVGSSQLRIKRSHIRVFDNMPVPTPARPMKYARVGGSIHLWPAPSSSYTSIAVRYWRQPTIDGTAANTTLVMPAAWEELLLWETYYRVLTIMGRSQEAQMLVMPSMTPKMPTGRKQWMTDMGIIPRLWNDLLQTIDMREGIDEDFSINPVRY